MWLWDSDLRRLGFRRPGDRCWLCSRRWGLQPPDHLSIFPWSELKDRTGPRLVELTEFHVTFVVGWERLHFYYHEMEPGDWQPGGHTSRGELRRLGCDPRSLRDRADSVAAQFIAALGGRCQARRARRR
ncbi:MAG: hypothetical protein JNM56_34245 [Planctomycetia bacterium]|nr:hypothetical protein [Planctomycetia bacterium]